MKKIKMCVSLILATVLFCQPILAAEVYKERVTPRTIIGQVTSSTGVVSRATIQPRNSVISAAMLTLSNKGNGVIGIDAFTTCHVDVNKIRMRIYVDQYDEAEDIWNIVDYYDFVFDYNPEDYPLGLHSAFVSFDVEGQQTGLFYASRGLHYVYPDNVDPQFFNTYTDGIRITKE